jgi:hypothetical protein
LFDITGPRQQAPLTEASSEFGTLRLIHGPLRLRDRPILPAQVLTCCQREDG